MGLKLNYIDEKIVFKGKYRTIVEKRYKDDKGNELFYETLKRPECGVCLALTKDNKIILEKEFRPCPGVEVIQYPCGLIDKGETIIQAMKRELFEETGYAGEPIYVSSIRYEANIDTPLHLTIALDCIKKGKGEKKIDVFLVDIDEFIKIATTNKNTMFFDIFILLHKLNQLKPELKIFKNL